jgi:serine/threonine-protein kinase RsbW
MSARPRAPVRDERALQVRGHPAAADVGRARTAGQPGRMDPVPLDMRLVALPEHVAGARRAVTIYARAQGMEDTTDLALAVSEAVTNAVQHAYPDHGSPGEVRITVQRHLDDGLEVWVRDEGRGMRPRSDSPGAGLGLPVIATLVQELEITRCEGGGTCVRMLFAAG